MGQYISTSRDNSNDELTNSLIKRHFIRTMGVEKAFRSVDRGFYYSNEEKPIAYRDSAWQSDQIHLSAPCVYAKVLECLELRPGHKFLNIGSGVGYFSTVAGLLLGRTGVNHGIEIRSSLINYAYQKMEEFKLSAAAVDHHEFCEPVFIHGNAFDLLPTGYYDRVYCGAGVPSEESEFIKSFIKIGGILVMPFEGKLVKLFRTGENDWAREEIMRLLCTNLVVSEKCSLNRIELPVEPLSLNELCRLNIRSILRKNLKQKFPNLLMRTKCEMPSLSDYSDDENSIDPLEQLLPMECEDGQAGVSSQNIVDALAEDLLEPSVKAPDGSSVNARVEGDEVQFGTNNANTMNEQTSSKRKALEAGCSERETSTETENSKRMKIDTPTQKTDNVPSTSSLTPRRLIEMHRISNNMIQPTLRSWENMYRRFESLVTHEAYINLVSTRNGVGEYRAINDESETDEEDMYSFKITCKENELSQHLIAKINLLPIPAPLKAFLNYYRTD